MASVLLVGTPNSGKTALFNRLTGLNHRVANYPGITSDLSVGKLRGLPNCDLVDFPGTYSLRPISEEERVAVVHFEESLGKGCRHVLCVIDATRLEKSLFFCLQVIRACQQTGRAVTVVANRGDILKRHDLKMKVAGLSGELGVPVLVTSARTGDGLQVVIDQLSRSSARSESHFIAPRGDVLASGGSAADSALYEDAHRLAEQWRLQMSCSSHNRG